jgi:hypothetical protein
MDAETVSKIVAMIDSRRIKLDAQWRELERGTVESGECLAVGSALADLKWAILDVHKHGGQLSDEDELVQSTRTPSPH